MERDQEEESGSGSDAELQQAPGAGQGAGSEEDERRRLAAKMNKAKKAKKKRAKAKKQLAASGAASAQVESKRVQAQSGEAHKVVPAAASSSREEDEDGLEFEDPFEDEFEQEDIVEGEEEEGDGEEDKAANQEEEDADDLPEPQASYYAPSKTAEGEELDYDPSAYVALHRMHFEWPALSFDFFRDHMGSDRTRFPCALWLVAGTQADHGRDNEVSLVHISSINRTHETDEDDVVVMEGEDEDEANDADPTLEQRKIPHSDGGVNRIRAMPQRPGLVASWSESGKVHLFDASKPLSTLRLEGLGTNIHPSSSSSSNHSSKKLSSVFTFSKHKSEGFALDWSSVRAGRLATGDCAKAIYVWDIENAGSSVQVNPAPFLEHKGSVEDLQWSPTEESVFASCSVDGTVKIWDVRAKNRSMLSQAAHEMDVNVISWNRKVAYLLASGSDDCSFKVWDLRQLSSSQGSKVEPVGMFKGFHTDAITSIEWSPHEESVICCASADHQVSVWDLALEEDREFARQASDQGLREDVVDEHGKPIEFPPQLLFVHAGLRDPKEVHFHPQIVGMIGVTAEQGFDLFLCEPLDPRGSHVANDV